MTNSAVTTVVSFNFFDFLKSISRWYKNRIGNKKGFGCCPNCGDSWNWKSSVGVEYEKHYFFPGCFISPSVSYAVSICSECSASGKFDYQRIEKHLESGTWEKESIAKAITALKEFEKNKKLTKN